MGLTIHWTLSTLRELSDAVVRELAVRTKAFAQKIGCEKALGPKCGGPDEIKLRQLPNGDTTGDFIPAESGWSAMASSGVRVLRHTGKRISLLATARCNVAWRACWVASPFCLRPRRSVDYFPLRAGFLPRLVDLQCLPHD